MFHLLSQIWSLFLTPSNLLVAGLAVGLALRALQARPGFGGALAGLCGGVLALVAIAPIGPFLLAFLENRFPAQASPPRVAGVIVLGGSVSLRQVGDQWRPQPNDAVDRLFVAADLAGRYPSAPVAVVGGPVNAGSGRAEADDAADYLVRLGVRRGRIVKERESADTFGNAQGAAAKLKPRPHQTWLVVTSAYHMPRAIGAFRKAGFEVAAAPADRRTVPWSPLNWSALYNLRSFDTAVREFVGLAAYWKQGRTDELLPRP